MPRCLSSDVGHGLSQSQVLFLIFPPKHTYVQSVPVFSTSKNAWLANDFLWIPNHFPPLFMAGRTTIICGFQTNFSKLFMAGRTTIICGFQTIFRFCLWREEQRLFVDSKPFSAHCLWREEQRLFVDSKPISAYVCGGKKSDYLWIPNQFPLVFMAGRTILDNAA